MPDFNARQWAVIGLALWVWVFTWATIVVAGRRPAWEWVNLVLAMAIGWLLASAFRLAGEEPSTNQIVSDSEEDQ